MKNKKVVIIPTVAILGLLLSASLAINAARAETDGSGLSIIQRLAQRFNLNEDDVKAVFDEARQERQRQMEANLQEKLDQLVSDDKITQEQKQAILAKREELRQNAQNFQDLSQEEREQERENHGQEMEDWANENGIDSTLLPMIFGGGRGGFGRPHFEK